MAWPARQGYAVKVMVLLDQQHQLQGTTGPEKRLCGSTRPRGATARKTVLFGKTVAVRGFST